MELKIYTQSGELKLTVSTSSSSTWNRELMTENAVSASFTHPFCVPLDVNDYVMLEGVKFSVKKEYKPKKKNSQEYSYSVKFYAPIHDAGQVMYLNLTDGQYEPQFSLDGNPRAHLQKWVDNMNRIYGEERWRIGDVIDAPNQTIEYSNTTCWDAIGSIAESFNTEWWSDGFYINLCRCERGERVELGYLQGLTSLIQTENSESVKFFTRLIPLGSTRNIDRSRYGFSRLQLPDRAKYVDRNTNYGLYEHVESDAFAGIFPHYTGTVSSVRSQEKTGEDKKPFTVYYFKDDGMGFDPSAKENEIAGLVKHVSFQSGELNGRDFEANYDSKAKEWEVINTYPDEETQIPGGNLIPAVGDTYIPWNFRMPVEYEVQAEKDYAAAVNTFLEKYSEDIAKYGGDTDYTYIDKNSVPLLLGQSVRLLSEEYFPATGYRDTRMTKVVRKLDNLSIATIECTNQVGKGWKQNVDDSLNGLRYVVGEKLNQAIIDVLKTWDIRELSEYNVMSSLRSRAEFLSKKYPDETKYLIKFLSGLHVGNFSQGSTGAAIYPDEDGNWHFEADYGHFRRKFTAEEVEILKTGHIGGKLMQTAARSICTRVEEYETYYRCYYQRTDADGRTIHNQWKVNDQAFVETFNLQKQADGRVGNHFFWRLVVGLSDDTIDTPEGYVDLSKTVCAAESDAPLAGDDIVLLGYQGTDDPDRQSALIQAGAGNGSPYIKMYKGIKGFTLPKPEIDFNTNQSEINAIVHMGPGSTGFENFSDVEFGKINLIRNSGFAGDYNSAKLEDGSEVTDETELYNQAIKWWAATNVTINYEDNGSATNRSATLATGVIMQTLYYSLIEGERYILSFKAKGSSVTINVGGLEQTQELKPQYDRYVFHFTAVPDTEIAFSGSCTITEIQLERGTVLSVWSLSPLDNNSFEAKFEALKYLTDSIREGSSTFIGGLGLLSMILVGNYIDGELKKVTGGFSGVYNDDDDPLLWGSGNLEKAVRTISKCKDDPMAFLNMSDAELSGYVKTVLTHGGRTVLSDAIVRGYLYAIDGYFKGTVDMGDGVTHFGKDGTGWIGKVGDEYFAKWDKVMNGTFCGGNIKWDNVKKVLDIAGKFNAKGGSKMGNLTIADNGAMFGGNAVFEDVGYTWLPVVEGSQDSIAAQVRKTIINQIGRSTTILLNMNVGQNNYTYTVDLPTRDELNSRGVSSDYGFRMTLLVTGSYFMPGWRQLDLNPRFRITSRPKKTVVANFQEQEWSDGEIHDNNDTRMEYIEMAKGDVLELYYYGGVYYLLNNRT